ncbi:putative polysaccharide biosynthesis protein [Anaerocolumna xylanovorans]|uniref:Stage V sporulation protein B n=1 Tax=Anaerocolumna xylanovorans DSM 12503 TaxID=1121345 RepID=A0A1M7YCA8_9FIRM|nr:polysaccharide biosynthesis protein [Anaerocolumna xylanovorans]SHO50206.1 stage V sporulation protein B [Anaerocolumna xylanovorans DSM 12503]
MESYNGIYQGVKPKVENKSNNFLVQGSILAIASIIVRIIGVVYRIPLTYLIGDEGMGYYGYAFNIYNIALILSSYSLPLAVSKLVASRDAKKQYKNSYLVFLCALGFAIITGTAFALILYFGADFFAVIISKQPAVAIPLRVLAPTILVFAIMGVLRGFFQGKKTMLPTSISQIIEQVVNAVVSIVAAYFLVKNHSASDKMAAYGAAGGTLGTLIGAIASLIFLAFIFALYKPVVDKQMRKDRNSLPETVPVILKVFGFTVLPVILSQTVYNISSLIDGSVFSYVLSGKGLGDTGRSALWGIYTNKYNILVNVPISIASAMAVAIVPSIVTSREEGAHLIVKEKIHDSIKFNMIIAIPSAFGIGVLASPILKLIFGDASLLPARMLALGSVAIVFYALSTLTNAVLQGINKMHLPVIHSVIALVIHIVVLYILLKFLNLGAYALVVSNVIFALIVCILNWISVARLLNYKQEIKKTFLIPAGCSVFMAGVAYLVYWLLYTTIKSNALSTLFAICVAMIVYAVLLLVFKDVTETELVKMPMGRTLARIAVKLHLL